MQRLSDLAHIVKCYEYNPKPISARSRPHKTVLVMELMEVRSAPHSMSGCWSRLSCTDPGTSHAGW